MSSEIRELIDAAINKPPMGSPCNNCGVCCMQAPCDLGQHVFKQRFGRCPALTKQDGWVCGLVTEPKKHAPLLPASAEELSRAAAHLIGSGRGCDARLTSEKDNRTYRKQLEAKSLLPKAVAKSMAAKWVWGAV